MEVGRDVLYRSRKVCIRCLIRPGGSRLICTVRTPLANLLLCIFLKSESPVVLVLQDQSPLQPVQSDASQQKSHSIHPTAQTRYNRNLSRAELCGLGQGGARWRCRVPKHYKSGVRTCERVAFSHGLYEVRGVSIVNEFSLKLNSRRASSLCSFSLLPHLIQCTPSASLLARTCTSCLSTSLDTACSRAC